MKTCDNCLNGAWARPKLPALKFPVTGVCVECCFIDGIDGKEPSNWKPMPQTNADRIRAMSDEELADFIQHIRTNTLLAEALGVPVSREKDLEFVRQPVKDGYNDG